MARFFTTVEALSMLPKGLVCEPSTEKPVNYVDELVLDKLKKLRLNPSEVCSDAECSCGGFIST
ncbi:MAG: hypothetical protein R3C12_20285 [Planctomycetaceae bacterium]